MKLQLVFDTVKAHLLAQMQVSRIVGDCAYRGAKGLKCAIGCLIPDSRFQARFNTAGIDGPYKYEVLEMIDPRFEVTVGDSSVLRRLQQTHDCQTPEAWSEALERFRKEHGLQ